MLSFKASAFPFNGHFVGILYLITQFALTFEWTPDHGGASMRTRLSRDG